jgi:DNA adenine methylase
LRQTVKVRVSFRIDKFKLDKLQEVYGIESATQLFNKVSDDIITGRFKKPPEQKLSAPITRLGGKARLAERIVALIPKHNLFIDLFGGAGHILLAKPKDVSAKEVFNDKHGDIALLYEAIQKRPFELRNLVLSYPCSRRFYLDMKRKAIKDPLERAARFFYVSRYSYYGDGRNGWNVDLKRDTQKQLKKIMDDILLLTERLKGVIIESCDWRYILRKYQGDENFFFVDPPYMIDNREKGLYELPFTRRDAEDLQRRLHESKGLFMVCHYENKTYDFWYNDYNKYQIKAKKVSSKAVDGSKQGVTENLYCNYDLPEETLNI